MKQHLSTLLEIVGSAALVVGACMVSVALGWAVGGAMAWVYARALTR